MKKASLGSLFFVKVLHISFFFCNFAVEMESMRTYWCSLSVEERVNTLTHLFPALATLVLAWPLMVLAYRSQTLHHQYELLGAGLFLLGMILMFTSSTLYHASTRARVKARLRIFDHISIYAMIAGSYSLICLKVVGGRLGWTLFGFLWGCVIAGVVGKIVALGRHPRLSLLLYLLMGWVALVVIVPIWRSMSHMAFAWIIAEGLFYTIGSYFFHHDEEHAFYHAIWHVFIVLGAGSHTVATWLILTEYLS